MVSTMKPGAVIVDLAAETGGNCELTRPGEEFSEGGVTIVGLTNLPSTMAYDASRLYSRNVTALLQHLAPEGELKLDFEDEIVAGACVTRLPSPASPWESLRSSPGPPSSPAPGSSPAPAGPPAMRT